MPSGITGNMCLLARDRDRDRSLWELKSPEWARFRVNLGCWHGCSHAKDPQSLRPRRKLHSLPSTPWGDAPRGKSKPSLMSECDVDRVSRKCLPLISPPGCSWPKACIPRDTSTEISRICFLVYLLPLTPPPCSAVCWTLPLCSVSFRTLRLLQQSSVYFTLAFVFLCVPLCFSFLHSITVLVRFICGEPWWPLAGPHLKVWHLDSLNNTPTINCLMLWVLMVMQKT